MLPFRLRPLMILVMCALPIAASAQERESLESLRNTTLNLIKALVQQGVLTQQTADGILAQAGVIAGGSDGAAASALPASPASSAGTSPSVRVPYIPEFMKRELRDQVRDEVLAKAREERWADPARLPEWLGRFEFRGEMTLRWEDDFFRPPCNLATGQGTSCNYAPAAYLGATGTTINNTNTNRQQLRLRALETVAVKVNDEVRAEFQLSTGSPTNPVTNFQTLGTYFARPTISLDRANITYDPTAWLRIKGGRFGNPFFGTDLLWYDRLGFDGVALQLQQRNEHTEGLFATIGAFPLQDIEPSQSTSVKTKWLYGAQVGAELRPEPRGLGVKSALALYDFKHVQGVPNDATGTNNQYSLSAPPFLQKGNTLFDLNGLNGGAPSYGLASKFRVLDWTTRVDLAQWDPVRVTWLLDAARNIGFDQNEITARTAGLALDPQLNARGTTQPVQSRVNAYGTRLTVGQPKIAARGDWQGYVGYKYVQRDAVLDAFNDPDFHLGGTDTRGWLAGIGVGLAQDTWLTLKYLSTESIDGPPLSIDVLQVDFNVRF